MSVTVQKHFQLIYLESEKAIVMPEDLPKAVCILLWLLIGVIVFGYLIMTHRVFYGFLFASVYYGIPGIWLYNRKTE